MSISRDIIKILDAGLDAVNAEKVISENVKIAGDVLNICGNKFDLKNFKNIYVLGAGKASSLMAEALEKILGNKITEGLVVAKELRENLKYIEETTGGHPVPDKKSLAAGFKILRLARKAAKNDLVIFLLSGGASSLMVAPKKMSLKEKQELTKKLLSCGADIKEINTIRKHISNIKGGNLAKEIYPATCVTLIISDVLGNDLSFIGSGPTVPDNTTFKDCLKIFEKYDLMEEFSSAYNYFKNNIDSNENETLKAGNEAFEKVSNFIMADLDKTLQSAEIEAKKLGYKTEILKEKIIGIAREEGEKFAEKVKELKNKTCLISGGETTVILTGNGRASLASMSKRESRRGGPASRRLSASRGGRNLELALGFIKSFVEGLSLDKMRGVRFLSAGTDGDDGTSGVAGALVGEEELKKVQELKLDFDEYLGDNNSLVFFQKAGGILKFPQNTNVGDIQILLKSKFIRRSSSGPPRVDSPRFTAEAGE